VSQVDDRDVVAEARKRFAVYLKSPKSMAPDTRRSVIAIVARHANADEWEHLHLLAKGEKSTLAKEELYALLGTARDKALAQRALDLALSSEAAVTTRPNIVASVGDAYPEMAFDLVNAHLAVVN